MSSRVTKKKIWRLKNMPSIEWLKMVHGMDLFERMDFDKFCYKYGLTEKARVLTFTSART